MKSTSEIASAVGRVKMQEALNVGPTAISKYVVAGKFPASWFIVLKNLCADIGLDCPPHLFGMKEYQSPKQPQAQSAKQTVSTVAT